MSATATSAPALASASASARPRPRAPPVTRATRPERSISIGTRHEYLTGDDQALDLRGALVDLEQLGVAHELLDRVLLDVAVAAEDLDRVGRDAHRGVGAVRLGVGRDDRRQVALVDHPRRLVAEEARRLVGDGHL